jgi:periplasmic protein TonB
MLLLLIAQAAVATPPPSIQTPPPVSTTVASMISNEDYPVEALRNDWQGTVKVKLRIGTNGRPRACRIVQSSGHARLDLKTCEIMLVRARFQPARDQKGNAVEDDFLTPPIVWRIEQDAEKPEPNAGEQR